MDLNKMVKAYVAMRNARAEKRKIFDTEDAALKEKQRIIEGALLGHLNEHNMDSVRTEAGTFYRQESIKPSCADWGAFWEWMKEEDTLDAMERRVKAAFIKEFMETNDGTLPPGISVHREYEVRVRRS